MNINKLLKSETFHAALVFMGLFVMTFMLFSAEKHYEFTGKILTKSDTQITAEVTKLLHAPTQLPNVNITTITLPDAFDENNFPVWYKIEDLLLQATNTTFVLRVSGMGGDALMLNDFIRAIQEAQQHGNTVNMNIIGPSASAHAFITCFANTVTIQDGASLLFHQAYGMSSLFFGFVEIRELASDPLIMGISDFMLNTCVANGRLTAQDVKTIRSGDDVILVRNGDNLVKLYKADNASIMNYTIPMLLTKLSSIAGILLFIGAITFIIRRVGKDKIKK